jgi:hypothetical protein
MVDRKGAGRLGRKATWAVAGVVIAIGVAALLMLEPMVHPEIRPVPGHLVSAGLPAPLPAPEPSAPASPPAPFAAVALTGCPPPPRPPGPPAPPPWHPTVLIPESALPAPPLPSPRLAKPAALAGKGMWIWQPRRTEGGNVDAIVRRAVAAGLTQLWVRVGDSQNGFYGSAFLGSLVPAAHAQGLAVIGWGFPYLYDPVADARWTQAALAWRAPGGHRIDGWSADIETASEGTALSARRASTYLGLVRPATGGRPLVATVFPPTDHWLAVYPYQAMAAYVDAFAPMIYWSCREPGDAAIAALQRLMVLAPVHLIGQAYDMGPEGGRVGHPAAAEISRFLDVARRGGATGASFWDWQEIDPREWAALSAYPWQGPVSGSAHAGGA